MTPLYKLDGQGRKLVSWKTTTASHILVRLGLVKVPDIVPMNLKKVEVEELELAKTLPILWKQAQNM